MPSCRLSISTFAFIYVATLGLTGPLVTLLFLGSRDSETFQYLLGGNTIAAVIEAYLWMVYSLLVLGYFYWRYAKTDIERYTELPIGMESQAEYLRYWQVCAGGMLACIGLLFYQNGFTHPLLSALSLSPQQYAYARIALYYKLNPALFSAGQYILSPLALVLAFRLQKGYLPRIITAALFVTLGTFSLAKAPMAVTIIEAFVISMLIKPIRTPFKILALVVAATGLMFFLTSGNHDPMEAMAGMARRVFLGEFADLPSYFRVFRDNPAPLASILPPYVQSLVGLELPPPSKLLYMHGQDSSQLLLVGMANTFFIGEAYAVGGIAAVVAAPFIAAATMVIVVKYFSAQPKNAINTTIFGLLAFKLLAGLFSGISTYVFSSIHILLALHFVYSRLHRAEAAL